jgi:peptide/nickel transport system substrate-binding protein
MALSGLQAVAVSVSRAAGTENLTTLTIGLMEPIDSLNPFIGINDNAYIFYGLVYDYLIAVDGAMQPKPNLAMTWNVVKEDLPVGSVWQYNLTHNATWHDGEPFTADDVVFTFEFQIGAIRSLWAYQPYTKLIQSVEKIDDYTVWIHFKDYSGQPAPCSFGDAIMVPIIPKHIWESVGAAAAGFAYENYLPVGTGPFMCSNDTKEQFLKGDQLVLTRNPEYHGYKDYKQKIAFDRIVLEWYLEPTAMVADMERGAIDLAKFDAPNYKNILDWHAANPNQPVGHYAGLQCTGFSVEVGINMKNTAGGNDISLRLDPAVRKAMAFATDKQFIVDHIYKGYGQTGTGMLTPMYKDWWWSPSNQTMQSTNDWGETKALAIPYSLDLANETLENAGYHWNSDHTVRVSDSTNTFTKNAELRFNIVVEAELTEDKDVATFLAEEYKVVGIQLDPMIVNTKIWNQLIYTPNYDLTITYWSGDPDPNYLLYVQSSYALDSWSDNFYSDAQYDQNYTGSVDAVNMTARKIYVDDCQMHTYYDVPYIVYAYPFGCYAWRTDHFSGWGNWSANPGRSFSNFYTANDLWFDLTPTGQHGAIGGLLTAVGIGVVVVIAAVVAAMLLMRRRGGRIEKEEDVRLP